jgi:hypothetical protein
MKLIGTSDESMTTSGTGEIDFVHKAMSLSLRGSANDDPITVDVRLVGGTVYSRTDSDWFRTPVSSADASTPNPASSLTYLEGVSSDVRVAGHETLRGVDTTRYTANIDFDRALAHATSPAQRKLFALALTMFGGVKIPTTAWIDGDGHLRKMELSLDLTAALSRSGDAVAGDPKLVETIEFFDFGAPVNVVAPGGAIDAAAAAQFRAAQSDLRNALTAEKTIYTDSQLYTDDPAQLRELESSLDWGGKLRVVVGDADGVHHAVVCLSEPSKAGPVFSLADVASGPNAGTYYGRSACPSVVDDVSMARLASHW